MSRFATLLSARLESMGDDTAGTQAGLAREMTRLGAKVTKQAVHDWCHGKSRPEMWKWTTLFDALALPIATRKEWEAALLDAMATRPADAQRGEGAAALSDPDSSAA